jgi:hypothetical protein
MFHILEQTAAGEYNQSGGKYRYLYKIITLGLCRAQQRLLSSKPLTDTWRRRFKDTAEI